MSCLEGEDGLRPAYLEDEGGTKAEKLSIRCPSLLLSPLPPSLPPCHIAPKSRDPLFSSLEKKAPVFARTGQEE